MKKADLVLKTVFSLLLTSTVFFASLFPTHSNAEALQCKNLFQVETDANSASASEVREELEANYSSRNETLVKRYPKLGFVFSDPEKFVNSMKQRFEAQKKITPEDPRLFDFPEAAPTLKEIQVDLEKFRQELVTELQNEKENLNNQLSVILLKKRSKKVETITKVLQYIKKLQADIDNMITTDHYPYRDTVYTLYYYSRIRGIFQFKELTPYYQVAKYIDMWMHGFRRLNVDAELQLYETKNSPIVQVRSGKISHEFRVAELPFRDAFERKDKLEYVIVPSVQTLGASALMHVLPHKIHIIGATNTPIPADGFNRPGGLFWMHDVRHESDRYMKINAYRKAQNLTANQEHLLSLYMQQWHSDFLKLKNSITDPDLKASLDHYHFYTHHDVGVPLIPSMFLDHHTDGISVYYAFLWHKKNAGQTPAFKDWFKNTHKTQEILTQFWTERLPIEKQLLQKDPVKIKKWEDWFPITENEAKSQIAVFNKAIESEALVRVKTENSGIDGVLSKVVYNEDAEPIYLNFKGEAQLIDRANEVIKGQGVKVHNQGYSTAIGSIKSVIIDGVKSDFSQIKPNQTLELVYESGVIVRGELAKWTLDETSALSVLTFKTAVVRVNEKTLYQPEWGQFDLLIGKQIESVEFLN